MIEMPFSPKQIEAYQGCDKHLNILCGAIRSGKTHISLFILLRMIREAPLGEIAIVGKSRDTIERNVLDGLKEIWGSSVHYNRGLGVLFMFNRKCYLIGANDERAEGKVRGPTFSGAYADEITLLPEGFFRTLTGRLSRPGAKLIGTTNPDSPFHWLKRGYIDRAKEISCQTYHFTMDDNPSLTQEYINQKKAEYTGLWYRRFILGEWCLAEGAVYDFFDEYIHCIPAPPTYAKYYIVGADYGTTNPTAFVMIGVNDDRQPYLWVEKEYYHDSQEKGYQKTDFDFANDLEQFVEGYAVKRIYLDPAAASFAAESRRRGLPVSDAINDVLDGIRAVASRLTTGDLKICHTCPNLIRELQSYAWDPRSSKTGEDRPMKKFDHAADALRYALYTCFGNRDIRVKTSEERAQDQHLRHQAHTSPWKIPGLAPGRPPIARRN